MTRRHLTECSSCVAYLSTFSALADDRAADPAPATAVDELLSRSPDRWERLFAVDRSRFATPAAVQALIQACEAALDSDLERAEVISLILTESADALPPSFASRTLQALAWTRRATALLRRGRLPEALAAVATAEERANDIPAADYERALISFTTADILRELGRTDEALHQIREAAQVFARYRDTRRHASAREMEAAVLFRCGEYGAAAAVFVELLHATPTDDDVVRGRLTANAAHCLTKTGDYARALPLFDSAEQIFAARGNHGFVARIAWGKARAIQAAGDHDAAVAAFRDVYKRFAALHATPEWIRVGIELVELLLPLGELVEARTICTNVHERAIAAGMQLQALEAVSYLREAAIASQLTVERAHHVRTFIEQLTLSSSMQFQRPA